MLNKQSYSTNEKGAVPLLILVAVIGVVAVISIINFAPFKDGVLSSLNPKKSSFASGTSDTFFKVTNGNTDVVPRQIVRTSSDKLYIFTFLVGTTTLKAIWTNSSGLPDAATAFNGTTQTTESTNIISVEAAYDGGNIVHVIDNTVGGQLNDHPFDLTTNTFKMAKTISTGNPTTPDIGTSGVSAMFDKLAKLHIAYWSSGNRISYKAYTYNASTDTLTQTDGPTLLDAGTTFAAHPSLAISPLDNSVLIAWVTGIDAAGNIFSKTKPSGGSFGAIEQVNTSPVWTSTSGGIDIDQGPSIIIDSSNKVHLTYIENWKVTSPNDYGETHYVTKTIGSASWTDTPLPQFYSHDPTPTIDSLGQIYLIGHGYPLNPSCTTGDDICKVKKNTNGTFANPQVFASHPSGTSFDSSPSVKWSVVGWNRPETVEFLFFQTPYTNPSIWYGRLATTVTAPSPSPSSGGISNPINPTPSPSKVGDFDGNGKIDIFDYNTLLTNFGHTGSGVIGDITGPSGVPDGVVSIYDYNLLLTNFGK